VVTAWIFTGGLELGVTAILRRESEIGNRERESGIGNPESGIGRQAAGGRRQAAGGRNRESTRQKPWTWVRTF